MNDNRKNPMQVKTFIFTIEEAENGHADDTVNAFSRSNSTVGIVLDRHNGKLIYRILYR